LFYRIRNSVATADHMSQASYFTIVC